MADLLGQGVNYVALRTQARYSHPELSVPSLALCQEPPCAGRLGVKRQQRQETRSLPKNSYQCSCLLFPADRELLEGHKPSKMQLALNNHLLNEIYC